jgi:acetyltransferase-like isoleucine patch superfamily enzyme
VKILRLLRGALTLANNTARHAADPVNYYRSKGARIGESVEFLGSSASTLGSEPYLISIGDGTTISDSVLFITHDGGLRVFRSEHLDAYRYAPIQVGANCFIGARAIIMPGVTIGDNSVIGAGSIVTRNVGDNVVVAGNPARVLKSINEYWVGAKDQLVTPPINLEPHKRRFLEQYFEDRDNRR